MNWKTDWLTNLLYRAIVGCFADWQLKNNKALWPSYLTYRGKKRTIYWLVFLIPLFSDSWQNGLGLTGQFTDWQCSRVLLSDCFPVLSPFVIFFMSSFSPPFGCFFKGHPADHLPQFHPVLTTLTTLALCMLSFTASVNLLRGCPHIILPCSPIFNILCPIYPPFILCTCPTHLNQSSSRH